MAEENETQENDENRAGGDDASSGGGSKGLLGLAIAIVVVVAAAGAGYALGRMLGGPEQAQADSSDQQTYQRSSGQQDSGEEYKYYEFTPITVNLNEPRLARYIRATITLAIRDEDWKLAEKAITAREPQLKNWLTVYFSERTMEDVRGAKKLNRLRREIRDALNDELDETRPLIDQVFFKEFAVQ